MTTPQEKHPEKPPCPPHDWTQPDGLDRRGWNVYVCRKCGAKHLVDSSD